MNYQIVKLSSVKECKNYIADTIDGEDGYTVGRTRFSFVLSYCGAIVLILKWQ